MNDDIKETNRVLAPLFEHNHHPRTDSAFDLLDTMNAPI